MKKLTLLLILFLPVTLLKAQEKGTFTDSRNGTVYPTITLAGQTWIAENLNYPVPGSWCYEDEEDNCVNYGRLYDWPAAKTACPAGWHLPSDAEWKKLISHFPVDRVGGILKSTEYWERPNTGAIDSIGFAAIPAGSRDVDTTYSDRC
ncbi:MAG: hypothetical protein FJY10_08995 [Bacteroidetes bacterium]|nr:hypothetical protein [Bacteroidota bacterium]